MVRFGEQNKWDRYPVKKFFGILKYDWLHRDDAQTDFLSYYIGN